MASNVLGARGTLETAQGKVTICRLQALEKAGIVSRLDRLPFSIRILLEGVLRSVDGELVTEADVRNLARWRASAPPDMEVPFMPARVLLQDLHRRPRRGGSGRRCARR